MNTFVQDFEEIWNKHRMFDSTGLTAESMLIVLQAALQEDESDNQPTEDQEWDDYMEGDGNDEFIERL